MQAPTGIAIAPSGNVYVADPGNHRVDEFTGTGAFVRMWGTLGSGDGQFGGVNLEQLAVGEAGNVYVPDPANHRVEIFDPDGAFLSAFGSQGYSDGHFFVPGGIATDAAGKVYVTDATGRVQRFSAGGAWEATLVTGSDNHQPAYDIAVASNGTFYIANWGQQVVQKYDVNGAPSGTLFSRGRPGISFSFVSGVATGAGDEVYVADTNAHEIEKFSADGAFVTSFDSLGEHIATRALTRVYASANEGHVNVFDPTEPIAVGSVAENPALTGNDVHFDAGRSSSPTGTGALYEWDFNGDGVFEASSGLSPQTTHQFSAPTVRPVGLRVRVGGSTDTTLIPVDVRAKPPAGAIGVSINNGAQFTNSSHVALDLVWPNFTRNVTVANDGGFARGRIYPVGAAIPWTLASSGSDRLPKTIYTRFDGATQTFSDDIILDEVAPAVSSAAVVGSAGVPAASKAKKHVYRVLAEASDNNSGVSAMQISSRKAGGSLVGYKRKRTYVATVPPRYLRVRDRAGNFSRWRRIVPISVAVRGSSRVKNLLRLSYSSPKIAPLRVSVLRRSAVVKTLHFDVDAGGGSVEVSTKRLRAGAYRIRARLDGYTFTLKITVHH